MKFAVIVIVAISTINQHVNGFQSTNQARRRFSIRTTPRNDMRSGQLYQSKQFDVSNPAFDLLSFRNIRGDALIRYDSLNQSEPLRIQLYAILCLTFLAVPSLVEALDFDPIGVPGTIGALIASVASGGLLVRECKRRSKQLDRIEKELNTQVLPIRLATNALADNRFSKPMTLKQLSVNNPTPPRIIALCGTNEKLQQALQELSIFGKRLEQASVYVVCIPRDESFNPYQWMVDQQSQDTISWLADSYDNNVWQTYFNSLSSKEDDNGSPSFLWFGLNFNGRSIGSGNEIPQWFQLLGQHFRPTMDDFELMEAAPTTSSSNDKDVATLSTAVETFYNALTTGNQALMKDTFSQSDSSQVSEVLDEGGRIDSWKDCLADGARPEGMNVSAAEVIVLSDTEAYTTVVESPANTGLDSATLLAVQKWTRSSSQDDKWELVLHQTIPWDPITKAQGTLRCDCRGCVALTRAPERQTFGGLIG